MLKSSQITHLCAWTCILLGGCGVLIGCVALAVMHLYLGYPVARINAIGDVVCMISVIAGCTLWALSGLCLLVPGDEGRRSALLLLGIGIGLGTVAFVLLAPWLIAEPLLVDAGPRPPDLEKGDSGPEAEPEAEISPAAVALRLLISPPMLALLIGISQWIYLWRARTRD